MQCWIFNTPFGAHGLYIFHCGLEFRAVSVTDTLGTKIEQFRAKTENY